MTDYNHALKCEVYCTLFETHLGKMIFAIVESKELLQQKDAITPVQQILFWK